MENNSNLSFSYSLDLGMDWKWLGLDKYQKIIYGVNYCDSYAVQFIKLDLFTGKFIVLKAINFTNYISQHLRRYEPGHNFWFSRKHSGCTLSNDGSFVGILFERETIFVFCLLEVETRNIYVYHFLETENFKTFRSKLNLRPSIPYVSLLLSSNENCWILAVNKTIFYQILLNTNTKEASLEVFTEEDASVGKFLFLDNKLVALENVSKMKVYDFTVGQWETVDTRAEDDSLELRLNSTFVQNNNLFSKSPQRRFLKYNSDEKLWRQVYRKSSGFYKDVLASSASFIITTGHSVSYQPQRTMNNIVQLFNFGNALSLRDICFLKLVKQSNLDFNSLTYEDILHRTIFAKLPQSLVRYYFGPVWTRTNE